MYQALYRKYRPKNFDEIVGQDIIVKILKNSITNNKLTHAYLFTGPRGTGKTSIAKILAKTINCFELKKLKPCDVCVSCTQINNNNNIDIIEIDAASNNGVDEIREINNKVNLVPSNSKYKVYIVDEVHMLTVGAFNALLKTLEEPPKHIIFILATTEPHKIPATILSRCQRYDFKKISTNNIVKKLESIVKEEKIEIDNEALFEIARLADGGLRDAISILDQVFSYSNSNITLKDVHEINGTIPQKEISELILGIINNDTVNIFKMIDKYDEEGKNLVKLIEEIILFLRNTLIIKTIPNFFKEKKDDEFYVSIANQTTKEKLFNLINQINNSLNMIKNYNNSKIVIELLMLKLIDKDKTDVNNQDVEKTINNAKGENKNKDKDKKEILNTKNKSKEKENKKDKKNISQEISKIKNIRINNAFTSISRQKMIGIKKKISNIQSLILDSEYGSVASMLIDGELKAYGADYLIFVYKTERLANVFNQNILQIEKMLKEECEVNCRVIATDLNDWERLRKEYKSKEKKYVYINENFNLEELLNKDKLEKKDDVQELFEQIIEYK